MATAAHKHTIFTAERRFYAITALIMATLSVGAFSLFALTGVSSFRAPLYVHIHAGLFMGWIIIFACQATLAATGSLAMHRKLGWLAVFWALAMVIVGTLTTI